MDYESNSKVTRIASAWNALTAQQQQDLMEFDMELYSAIYELVNG